VTAELVDTTGPVWPPTTPSIRAGGCTHCAPVSCRWCSGDADDDRDLVAADRAAARTREHRHTTRPEVRAAWWAALPPATRALLAAAAAPDTERGAA